MATLKQSTAYTRTFLMVDSSDHLSPKTGLTVGVYLSKAGGAFGAVSGSVSEISFGWYKAALNATDTNTLGDLAYHCTGSAADLTDFVDQVRVNILGDTIPANVTQWLGVAPNALISGTVDGFQHYPVTQDANLVTWKGTAPNNLISGTVDAFSHYANPTQAYLTGTVDVNVTLWRGTQPNALVSGTVDGFAHYANTLSANVIQWNGTTPNNLVSGTVDAFAHYANTVSANVIQWRGTQPNILISGTVDSFEHYGNPIQSYHTGTVDANLIQIDGLATNGFNATLKLKQLYIQNSSDDAFIAESFSGKGALFDGSTVGMSVVGNGDTGLYILGNGNSGLLVASNGYIGATFEGDYGGIRSRATVSGNGASFEGAATGTSISVPQGITGDVYGDIHGYVGWVTGSVQNVLISTPAAPPTGTVNANVIQWVGDTPNLLISGTVDAFSHYSNPVQANVSITGTLDANVVTWKGTQPNDLISGTVDAYAHYISTDAVTSIWSNATRTLTSFGTLIADIWAAVVDSSGVTTLLSRLTAGRATNLDNLDDAISNVPTANENADALLKRDWTAVTGEASRSVLNALRFIRNKFSTTAHANKVTIYKEDDTTEAYQKDVTTDATADPIVEG